MSLEEHLQAYCDALDAERNGRWRAGDIILAVLRQAGTRKARGAILRTFAQLGHCSVPTTRWRADLAGSFEGGQRMPELAESWYRAVVRAARRTETPPPAMFEKALEAGWHVAQLEAYGRETHAERRVGGKCVTCGATVSVRVMVNGDGGVALPCPLCVVRSWAAGKDAREVDRIGVLA